MKEKRETDVHLSPARTSRCISSRATQSRILPTRSSDSTSQDFIRGEGVPRTALSSLSALYRPAFSKYPSFPSIYESKYQHDFRYVPWPAKVVKKEHTPPPDYRNFKFGSTSYSNQFQYAPPIKNDPFTPISQHRRHNPQPSIRNVQNYPDHVRWIWSEGNSKRRPALGQKGYIPDERDKWRNSPQPRWHRWNSR